MIEDAPVQVKADADAQDADDDEEAASIPLKKAKRPRFKAVFEDAPLDDDSLPQPPPLPVNVMTDFEEYSRKIAIYRRAVGLLAQVDQARAAALLPGIQLRLAMNAIPNHQVASVPRPAVQLSRRTIPITSAASNSNSSTPARSMVSNSPAPNASTSSLSTPVSVRSATQAVSNSSNTSMPAPPLHPVSGNSI
jgi:hypothetical protein